MKIVGRSRKVKIVVGGETVEETLSVAGRGGGETAECHYLQTEGAFSQPNAGVCEHMLAWAYAAAARETNVELREENPKTSPENLINTFCGAP